jgi:hypothetical protein
MNTVNRAAAAAQVQRGTTSQSNNEPRISSVKTSKRSRSVAGDDPNAQESEDNVSRGENALVKPA